MYNEKAYLLGSNRSCIRELFEFGRSRAAVVGQENVFDYSIGNPSIPSPPEVNETIRQVLADTDSLTLHGYTTAVGDLEARQAIADDLNRRYSTDISPQELFLGCGAAPELCAVFRALTVPGARFLVTAPYFPEYVPFVDAAGAAVDIVMSQAPHFRLPVEEMEKALTANTVAVILNSPNNPSGTVYTREELQELARVLTRKGEKYGHPIYIVADEPYRELVYDGVQAPFIPDIYPNTIVCYSYSKSLSLPGERLGYVYVPKKAADGEALYAAVAGAARGLGHVCAPSIWQKVIARCAHLRPDLQAYDRNRRALYQGLLDAGYEAAKPDGAFYLFVRAPGGDSVAFSELAKTRDVLVVPGEGFGYPGWVRLCYCVSYEKIIRSLPLFRELIRLLD